MKVEREYVYKLELDFNEISEILMVLRIFLENSDLQEHITKERVKKIEGITKDINDIVVSYD